MEHKEDRRKRMTKKILHETLIELLQDTHISELSVKQICEAADLNRSTFYAHYQSPMELFQEIEQEAYDNLTSYFQKKEFKYSDASNRMSMKHTLEYVKKNPELFRVLLGSKNFKQMSLSIAENYFYVRKRKNEQKYIKHFYYAGWFAIVEEWLNNGCIESIDEICDIAANLIRIPE